MARRVEGTDKIEKKYGEGKLWKETNSFQGYQNQPYSDICMEGTLRKQG